MEAIATQGGGGKAPAHLWIVGLLSLLWNAFGCFDYAMTNMRVPAYVAQLPADMIDYIDAFPFWAIIAWGVGVGGGLLGALGLLGRSVWAGYAFAFSVLGLALTTFYQLSGTLPASMSTPGNWGMTAVIWILALAQLFYALRMRAKGVLR